LSATAKRWIALGVFAALAGAGTWAALRPDAWEQVAVVLAAAAGAGQAIYTALKSSGLIDWLTGPPPEAEPDA